MKKVNGMINTYDDSFMTLSCEGTMAISNGIITDIYIKGYPRPIIDEWTVIYKYYKIGDKITKDTIDLLLEYNGKNNIISMFKEIL